MTDGKPTGCLAPGGVDKRCIWCMCVPESDACLSWQLKTEAVSYIDEVKA